MADVCDCLHCKVGAGDQSQPLHLQWCLYPTVLPLKLVKVVFASTRFRECTSGRIHDLKTKLTVKTKFKWYQLAWKLACRGRPGLHAGLKLFGALSSSSRVLNSGSQSKDLRTGLIQSTFLLARTPTAGLWISCSSLMDRTVKHPWASFTRAWWDISSKALLNMRRKLHWKLLMKTWKQRAN